MNRRPSCQARWARETCPCQLGPTYRIPAERETRCPNNLRRARSVLVITVITSFQLPAPLAREEARSLFLRAAGAAILAARQPRANRGRAAIQPRPSLDRAEPNRNKLVRTAPNRDRSVLALRSNRA
ncbi:hypothetical protein [Burkholderia pseudomallei]|uniref:hypothetical protein n=1 Tax=Burkholderia pseudomallei TaxID=28450 RepID=UPI00351C4AB4